uniref:G-protein coupled receptors family 1 profile domain-containing protein n=1 Tax=Kryptolebias marmoratus TaxID=37003 RepID=A0A3Q3A8C4_KRYMA
CFVLVAIFAFALPVGILGNLAVLVYNTCLGRTLSTSNVFLVNLALCDSAWILTLPLNLHFRFQRPDPRDLQTFCKIKHVSFNVSIYGSILFLTLISFDRYVGTVHPISSLRWWNVGKAKMCSVCAWAGLMLIAIPDFFLTFAVQQSENVTVCLNHFRDPFHPAKTIILIRTTVCFLLPLCIMLFFYVTTVRALRRPPKGARRRGAQQTERKPLRLIAAAVLVFAASFVPYHLTVVTLVIMQIRDLIKPSDADVLYVAYELCEAICTLSSCLDPVLYLLATEQFKRKLLALKRDRYTRPCCRASNRVGVMVMKEY